jgi:hypothetical protein
MCSAEWRIKPTSKLARSVRNEARSMDTALPRLNMCCAVGAQLAKKVEAK